MISAHKDTNLPQRQAGVRRLGIYLLAVSLLSITGCGGPGYPLAPVSGLVEIDGKPLADAQVLFSPVAGQTGPSSVGTTDDQGHFELVTLDQDLAGAVPGQHQVTITTSKPAVADERSKIPKERVPRKYRDGSFKFEVPEEGSEVANIEILTK